MIEKTLTIGAVADLKRISVHTLRFYDKKGLLPNVYRDKNGVRQFTKEDLKWIDMIKCLKDTGMSLEQIKFFIDATYEGSKTLTDRIDLLRKQAEKIKNNIEQQQSYLEQINTKIETLMTENNKV